MLVSVIHEVNWIVVHLTGPTIRIQLLQPVTSLSKTVLPLPEPTVPATLLFLGNSSSLPEIETLWVNESETDSVPCERMKTNLADVDAKLANMLCKSWVLAT